MPQDFAPFHTCLYLDNVTAEISYFRVSGELCLRLKFRARSDRQHKLCNNLTFWWYSGLRFKITNLEKMNRLQKTCKITQHANTLTELEVSRFQHCRQCGLRCFRTSATVFLKLSDCSMACKIFTVIYVMICGAHKIACTQWWRQLFLA